MLVLCHGFGAVKCCCLVQATPLGGCGGAGSLGGRDAPPPPPSWDLDCFVKRGGQLLAFNDNRNTHTHTHNITARFTPDITSLAGQNNRPGNKNQQQTSRTYRLVLSNMASRSANTQTGMGTSRQSMATSGSAIKARQLVCVVILFPPPGRLPSGDKHAMKLELFPRWLGCRSTHRGQGTLTTTP